MKHCPSCKTNYADDTLQFCLQDGTQLTGLSDTNAPTVAFNDTDATVIRPTAPEQANVGLPETQAAWQEKPSEVTRVSPQIVPQHFAAQPQAPPRRSNTALIVLLTAFVMLFIFGAGIGAWFLLGNRAETGNTNGTRDFFPSPSATSSNSNIKIPTPSPSASVESNSSNMKTPAPTPEFDAEQIKTEVASKMNAWKSSMESGNLDAVMSHYADRLEYYYRSGATSASFVRNNKKPAFEKFYAFRVNIAGMRVTPDSSGQKATAVFTKSWTFEGSGDRSQGSVRAQFQLTKIAGRWYITGEKDL